MSTNTTPTQPATKKVPTKATASSPSTNKAAGRKQPSATTAPATTKKPTAKPATKNVASKRPEHKISTARTVERRVNQVRQRVRWVGHHPFLAALVVVVVVGRVGYRAVRGTGRAVAKGVRHARFKHRQATAARSQRQAVTSAHAGCDYCAGTGTIARHNTDGTFAGSRRCPHRRVRLP
jgi:hypothetical protein